MTMSINTKKDANYAKAAFNRKAMLFDELSLILYNCGLFLYLFPKFSTKEISFPPDDSSAGKIYDEALEYFSNKNNTEKIDEIFQLVDRSMETKLFPFLHAEWEFLKKSSINIFELSDLNKWNDIFGVYVNKPDFQNFAVETIFLDVIIYDLNKLPSPVNFSDYSSFVSLAADCNDMAAFHSIPLFKYAYSKSKNERFRFNEMILITEKVGNELISIANQLIGYRMAKLEQQIANLKGADAKRDKKQERVNSTYQLVKEKGKRSKGGFQILRDDFNDIMCKVFEVNRVADPTIRTYRLGVNRLLSEKYGEDIELELIKS